MTILIGDWHFYSMGVIISCFECKINEPNVFGKGWRAGYGNNVLSLKRPDNEADSPVVAKITPRPVDKNNDAVSKTDQKHEMDKHPHEPGKDPLEFNKRKINDGTVPSDGRHDPEIPINKGAQISFRG